MSWEKPARLEPEMKARQAHRDSKVFWETSARQAKLARRDFRESLVLQARPAHKAIKAFRAKSVT